MAWNLKNNPSEALKGLIVGVTICVLTITLIVNLVF